jgi:hypothetical protein
MVNSATLPKPTTASARAAYVGKINETWVDREGEKIKTLLKEDWKDSDQFEFHYKRSTGRSSNQNSR